MDPHLYRLPGPGFGTAKPFVTMIGVASPRRETTELDYSDTKGAQSAARIDQYVGERIRRRRVLLGFTQEQLGGVLEISYQQIQKYETGSNRVSAGRLYQIAQRLDVPIAYFFEGLEPHAMAASSGRALDDGLPFNGAGPRMTIELVRNFNQIEEQPVRTAVSALVKSLSQKAEQSRDDDDASAFGEFASGPRPGGQAG